MEFMSGYYRQREDSTALLLQQYVCRGVPVCLGCICGGEGRGAGMAGGLFTGLLLKEFRGTSLSKAVGKPSGFLEGVEKWLYRCRESCVVPAGFWTAGILCIGEDFLLFSEGGAKIILCNMGFGRPSLHEIGENDAERRMRGPVGSPEAVGNDAERRMRVQRGSMEAGIGLLLASESFYRSIPRADMQNCLWVKEINDSRQTQKRICELGGMAEKRGGRGMGALLLEVR